eukprot:334231-Prymnesium_polylepis.1
MHTEHHHTCRELERAATGESEWHGGQSSPCHTRLRSGSAATFADFTSASAPEALEGHAFA